MYDKDAQFDRGWTPVRYPPYDESQDGVWTYVLGDGQQPIGLVWLSGDSAGVKWVTQTDDINRLIKFFNQYAAIGASANDAYNVATKATDGITYGFEVTGPMSKATQAITDMMNNITDSQAAPSPE